MGVVTLEFSQKNIPCVPARLDKVMDLYFGWRAEDGDERAIRILAGAPRADPAGLSRYLIACSKERDLAWSLSPHLLGARKAIGAHSGLYRKRTCECVTEAWDAFCIQFAGAAWVPQGAPMSVKAGGPDAGALSDWLGGADLDAIAVWHGEPSLRRTPWRVVAAVDAEKGAFTATFFRKNRSAALTLARASGDGRDKLATLLRAYCPVSTHPHHSGIYSLVSSWPDEWIPAALAAAGAGNLQNLGCPYLWPDALGAMNPADVRQLSFVRQMAATWTSTFASLAATARSLSAAVK